MSIRCKILQAVLILGATAAATPGIAQNLVFNPNFDTDMSGWTSPGVWDTLDVDGSSASGSATYLNTSAGMAGFLFVRQCITIDPGTVGYDLSAWTLVPSGQPATGYAQVGVAWYTDTQCADYLDFAELPPPSTLDAWVESSGSVYRPFTAQSVRISATNQKFGPGNFQVWADAFTLEANTSSIVFGDGFETGNPAAWSSVVPGPG